MNQEDFPFEEIRAEHGDLFATIDAAKEAGYDEDQIWSVTDADSDDPDVHSIWVYGPPRHYVNVLGYVCTRERHDDDTYYEEVMYRDD